LDHAGQFTVGLGYSFELKHRVGALVLENTLAVVFAQDDHSNGENVENAFQLRLPFCTLPLQNVKFELLELAVVEGQFYD